MSASEQNGSPTRGENVVPNTEPERTCVGCRTRSTASAMVRFKVLHGKVVVEGRRTLPGRGAWLCPRPECLDRALRGRAFLRAFRQDVLVPDRIALWSDISEQVESLRQARLEEAAEPARDGGA